VAAGCADCVDHVLALVGRKRGCELLQQLSAGVLIISRGKRAFDSKAKLVGARSRCVDAIDVAKGRNDRAGRLLLRLRRLGALSHDGLGHKKRGDQARRRQQGRQLEELAVAADDRLRPRREVVRAFARHRSNERRIVFELRLGL
jgi:hypothetical protein